LILSAGYFQTFQIKPIINESMMRSSCPSLERAKGVDLNNEE